MIKLLSVYLLTVILITIVTCYFFLSDKKNHEQELKRINEIEKRLNIEATKLKRIQSMTKECPYSNLTDPRSCYFKSNHKCRWNEEAKRCDLHQ